MHDIMICFHLFEAEEKAQALAAAIWQLAEGHPNAITYVAPPQAFSQVPHSPFAYWVSGSVRSLFTSLPKFEQRDRNIRVGLATTSDPVFVRLWTEVASEDINRGAWIPYAKGGSFSRYYQDVHLVVDWEDQGCRIKARVRHMGDAPSRYVASEDRYLEPGLTYPRRTQGGFNVREMPRGCIFANKGPSIFVADNQEPKLLSLLGLMNSAAFRLLLSLQMAFGSFEVGVVQRTPIPDAAVASKPLADLARQAWSEKRSLDVVESLAHVFITPALLTVDGDTLSQRADSWSERIQSVEKTVAALQAEIDDLTFEFYGLVETDRAGLAATEASSNVSEEIEEADRDDSFENVGSPGRGTLTASTVDYILGCAFGRWDIRYATGERPAPELPEPFASLPVCPPGMLQDDDGLPLSPDSGRQLRAEGRYPLNVAWEGILVDDPEHPLDIESHIHSALAVIWGERVDAIQQEACNLLGVPTLREWFRRPAGFFADHLKRYSKSRRKAPIYWPISTSSSSYTVWLYYHRFSKDTFFKVREIVGEKQGYEQRKLQRLKEQYGTQPSRSQSKEIETQERIANEIKSMGEEIDRIAPLWNPNLNDGVIINFAPLWRLVPQHKAWQKECKECWDELVAGNYDWAHVAMHLWPERVVPKCVSDASLAIAHGLEDTFWQRDDRDRLQPKPKPAGGWQPFIDELVQQRSSPAVKAALKSLLEAPVAGAGAKKGRGRRGATS